MTVSLLLRVLKFNQFVSGIEDEQLSEKVITLKEKCNELTQSIDTVQADYATIVTRIKHLKVSVVQSKVIQEEVAKLATLDDFLSDTEMLKTRKLIEKLQLKVSKALKVNDQIAEKKRNPNLLNREEMEETDLKIAQAESLLKSIQLPIKVVLYIQLFVLVQG